MAYLMITSMIFQITHPPKQVVLPDLTGKVAIVTGGNTGIGYWTAKRLAQKGARVIIACRSQERGQEAVKQLKGELGSKTQVEYMKLDLSEFSTIPEFVKKFQELNIPLHILVNNAGLMACPQSTIQGEIETQFGVNYLGHFLLTNLLVPKLKANAPSRIVHVSSYANYKGDIHFDDLQLKENYTPFRAYCQSKLANIVFSNELAERLKGTGVTSTSLHPGDVQTDLMKYVIPIPGGGKKLMSMILRTPEQGSDTSVFLAASESAQGETGNYWMECEKCEPNPIANDPQVKKKLWEVSHSLVQKYLASS